MFGSMHCIIYWLIILQNFWTSSWLYLASNMFQLMVNFVLIVISSSKLMLLVIFSSYITMQSIPVTLQVVASVVVLDRQTCNCRCFLEVMLAYMYTSCSVSVTIWTSIVGNLVLELISSVSTYWNSCHTWYLNIVLKCSQLLEVI